MSITSGYTKYKRYAKLSDGTYKLISQWTNANTVHFDDGSTAQTNLGAIKGITDSLTATSSNIALSAKAGNNLQGQIDTVNSNLQEKSSYCTILNVERNFTLTASSQDYAVEHTGFYCIQIVSTNSTAHDLAITVNNNIYAASQYAISQFQRCVANIPLKKGSQITFIGNIGDIVNINYGSGNI